MVCAPRAPPFRHRLRPSTFVSSSRRARTPVHGSWFIGRLAITSKGETGMTQAVDVGALSQDNTDSRDLRKFGYRQELHRTLGLFSSFAAAFSYISPSTGIFTLFALGLGTLGGVFIWSWPIVAIGQFLVALNFAEVSSHYPVAGSVFQWTKYLAGRQYAWFTGWIYIFAGILTVTAVVVTLPLTLLPAFKLMGWNLTRWPSTTRSGWRPSPWR